MTGRSEQVGRALVVWLKRERRPRSIISYARPPWSDQSNDSLELEMPTYPRTRRAATIAHYLDHHATTIGASRRNWSRLISTAGVLSKVVVDQRDGHCAFSDGGRDAFDRAVPDITGNEDSGLAGFQR